MIGFTRDPVYVERLDLVSFNALCDAVTRLRAREKLETAVTYRIMQHGQGDSVKKWLKQWENEAQINPPSDGEKLRTALRKR